MRMELVGIAALTGLAGAAVAQDVAIVAAAASSSTASQFVETERVLVDSQATTGARRASLEGGSSPVSGEAPPDRLTQEVTQPLLLSSCPASIAISTSSEESSATDGSGWIGQLTSP